MLVTVKKNVLKSTTAQSTTHSPTDPRMMRAMTSLAHALSSLIWNDVGKELLLHP